jgi:fructose-1,6-bisphosphatase/sedoheptulose 1,7-bisphosphatase-like protein
MGVEESIQTSAKRAGYADHLAVRLADLDLTRATDQTAILMSLFASLGGNQPSGTETADSVRGQRRNSPQGDRLSLALMLGYLAHAYCRGSIIHLDARFKDKRSTRDRDLWSSLYGSRAKFLAATVPKGDSETGNHPIFGVAPIHCGGGQSPWDLEFVISPLDGTRALLGGMRTGTISAIAGGPPGSFIAETNETLASNYFLIALAPFLSETATRLTKFAKEALDAERRLEDPAGDLERASSLEEGLSRLIDKSLQEIQETSLRSGKRPTLATSTNKPDFADSVLRQRLVRLGRTSTSIGSALVAGLEPFFPEFGVDAYVGIVRKTQALQIAAGAQASGGSVVAIPVEEFPRAGNLKAGGATARNDDALVPRGKGAGSRMRLAANSDALVQTQSTLVPNNGHDVFLIATGVTDTGLLRKVQVGEDGMARTHTLCMRSRAKSCRVIETSHDLRNRVFRVCSRNDQVIRSLLADLQELNTELRFVDLPGSTARRLKTASR